METWAKSHESFPICQHKTEYLKNIQIYTSTSQEIRSFGVKQAWFPQSRMTAFQTSHDFI